jgi:DEAD/DEAH box helicase domain-containing protein
MVHSGILPHHPRWAKLFENLRYVIIDELHAYRGSSAATSPTCCGGCGAFAGTYGSSPVFLCSSATIANPRDLAERLTEQPFELVDKNGAPRGEKAFVFVNPPVVNRQLGIRRSYLGEARRIAAEFLKRNLQLIVFAQSRLSTEILTTYLKEDFEGVPAHRTDPRLSGRLPAESPRKSRRGSATECPGGRVDERARARHRHRRARRGGAGGLSRARSRPRGSARAAPAAAPTGRRR